MSIYVLIHGAWHGGWCWDKVRPLLERRGHLVYAPDLPGHGQDKTPPTAISLQTYTDHVCQLLDTQPEPVVLVGHSMGGMVITQTAEHRPQQIRTLVYLTAFLPRNGEVSNQLIQGDPASLVPPNVVSNEAAGYLTLREEALREVFYGQCAAEDVQRATTLLVPEPLAPTATPVRITAANFGRIPRVYIECIQDRAISPALQRQMYTASPCHKVLTLDTDHSPFFSTPEELADLLASV